MKVVALIQARLNSTRLHQKMLLPLLGKPMLYHVIERVKRAKLLDEVMVTIPHGDYLELAPIMVEAHVRIHARTEGYENDLVQAYWQAANLFKADVVIRIPADNPMVQWEYLDDLVECQVPYLKRPMRELVTNLEHHNYDHDGFGGELYPREMLEWMHDTLADSKHREHPHLFWREMEKEYYVGSFCFNYRPFRLDVNTEADYERVKAIYDECGTNDFNINDVLAKR